MTGANFPLKRWRTICPTVWIYKHLCSSLVEVVDWRIRTRLLWIQKIFEAGTQIFPKHVVQLQKCTVTKEKLRIPRSRRRVCDPAAVVAKCMKAAWEQFQTHSLGRLKKKKKELFFSPFGIWMIFQSKARAKACGCVGEIRIPSNVQSLEIHMPHNVKAFLFTIYNA